MGKLHCMWTIISIQLFKNPFLIFKWHNFLTLYLSPIIIKNIQNSFIKFTEKLRMSILYFLAKQWEMFGEKNNYDFKYMTYTWTK